MDPSTFLGSVWGMIWRVKYLLRQCLDPVEQRNARLSERQTVQGPYAQHWLLQPSTGPTRGG
jgi:hypothetical protein